MTEEPAEAKRRGKRREILRAIVVAIVVAGLIRVFVIEPFIIPSGSMIPTLLVGDYLMVNKFAYGIRLPITGKLLLSTGEAQRGDVIVFRYRVDPLEVYFKRFIGFRGDVILIVEGWVEVKGLIVDLFP